jgi:hypothetical protein
MASISTNDIAPPEFTIRVPKSQESLAAAAIQEAINRHTNRPDSEQVYLPWLLTHPQAPEEALLRLCEQGLYLDDLGHRQGPRSLLEMLAFRYHYPEAVLTLGKQIYANPAESASVLHDFLRRQLDQSWLFESLAGATASSPEKEQVFLDVARQLPVWERVRDVYAQRQDESRAAAAVDAAEIERLYHLRQPSILRGLARNPHTPESILKELCAAKGHKFAREIRNAAAATLSQRSRALRS